MKSFMYPKPPWSSDVEIAGSLSAARAARTKAEADGAYNRILDAIGCNSDGSYFPVVLEVLPELNELIAECTGWPQYCALGVMLDLVWSFEPVVEHRLFTHVGGSQATRLWDQVRAAVGAMRPAIERIANSNVEASSHAAQLLDYGGGERAPRRTRDAEGPSLQFDQG